MEKEKLLEEANKARQIAVCLAENIYAYLGDEISKEDLKAIVDALMADDIITRFNHLYIKKDAYKNTFVAGFMNDPSNESFELDDTDDLKIIGESDI